MPGQSPQRRDFAMQPVNLGVELVEVAADRGADRFVEQPPLARIHDRDYPVPRRSVDRLAARHARARHAELQYRTSRRGAMNGRVHSARRQIAGCEPMTTPSGIRAASSARASSAALA